MPPRDTTRRDSVVVPVPPRPDSTRADSAQRVVPDSTRRRLEAERLAADSIKDPIARGEMPTAVEIGGAYRWDREALFATGAVNLLDLLDRIPGVTSFRSGWVVSAQTASYLGDFSTVRVFLDGVALDPLDEAMGGMLDLSTIQLWSLEEVLIERAAREIRVHLRSWRVARTTPATRVDVSTGDLETNTYRGYFGRRFHNGAAMQLGAQQFSTSDPRNGGDGDQLSFFGRTGWASGNWTLDVVANRARRSRTLTQRLLDGTDLPAFEGVRLDAYLRAAYGDPDAGRWAQLVAATSRITVDDAGSAATSSVNASASSLLSSVSLAAVSDSNVSRVQYIATGGFTSGAARLSAAARMRVFGGERYLSPSVRAGFDRRYIGLSAFAERRAEDSTMQADVALRLTPFRWLALAGAVARAQPISDSDRPASTVLRAEAGIRIWRAWATAGVFRRDTADVAPPIIYDPGLAKISTRQVTGTFANVRGLVWRAVGVDLTGVRWSPPGSYRPQYQSRAELYARTNWLGRFPSGNFGVGVSVIHEYRTEVAFPTTDPPPQTATQFRAISTLLELRLYDAILSWQYRNVLGFQYTTVPGFEMPRAVNFYGVRWEFFN